jgi:transposase
MSASVGISKGSVSDYLSRAEAAGLTWAEAAGLDEEQIERRLFAMVGRNEPATREPIDFACLHREMRRTGV